MALTKLQDLPAAAKVILFTGTDKKYARMPISAIEIFIQITHLDLIMEILPKMTCIYSNEYISKIIRAICISLAPNESWDLWDFKSGVWKNVSIT